MDLLLLICRLLLAAIFMVAGIAKLADLPGSRKSMRDFGVPESLAGLCGFLLPVAELVSAGALLPAATAWWGAAGILGLLILFIGGIGYTLLRGRRPDCHCFGQMQSAPIGWDLVMRNALLACVALPVVARGPGGVEPGLGSWWRSLNSTEAMVAALAAALVCLAAIQLWGMLALLRQNGRLLLRIEALENRAPAAPAKPPAPEPDPGLPVNTPAPDFTLKNLAGETVPLHLLRRHGKPLLLFFMEPGCGSCDAALPDVALWQREYADRMIVVPISSGGEKANRAKVEKARVAGVLLQKGTEAMDAYRIAGTPGAVLVKDGLIASPAALGAESIGRLVSRAVLPPAVSKGEPVPSLKLPGLDGNTFDVAGVRQRTLVLFWNPGCGFCQRMLKDLRAWEANPPAGAPELLVISAGLPDDIRRQDIRATILLDPYFAASQVFQSGGTPSAVLIGEDGRIASDVAVGADEVMRLAGAVPAAAILPQ